jgi:molecular chaperone GrpE
MSSPDSTDTLNPDPSAEPARAQAAPAPDALAAAKQEAAENYDRYVRSVADLDNFRRRTMREKDELRQFATARVLEDLLPVMDNLVLGLTAAKQPGADLKALASGVELVLTQLKSVLSGHGLKEISPLGLPFDANLHESISAQPSPTVPEGVVVTVVRTGYALNGRLLRPAAVVVSSGPAKRDGGKA